MTYTDTTDYPRAGGDERLDWALAILAAIVINAAAFALICGKVSAATAWMR